MAHTRAQLAAQKRRASSVPEDQGTPPKGIWKRESPCPTTRVPEQPIPKGTPGTKRPADVLDGDLDHLRKRSRLSPRLPLTEDTPDRPAIDNSATRKPLNPIEFWAKEGRWPQEYFEPDRMTRLYARKNFRTPSRKRSYSTLSGTSSGQTQTEAKSAAYRDPRYETLLETKGSFMRKSSLDITDESKAFCRTLFDQVTVPENSLFRDDIFTFTCEKIHNKNKPRLIQDIARLIVPSAETLATFGEKHLDILTESVNEGWDNSIPLTGTRPQPDYSVGFRREAFTNAQLTALSPYIGDFVNGDLSYFMATYYMYFPFLTCEVECGALKIAARQNAHSMTLAVRAVAELFVDVGRGSEVDRQILGFSISHNETFVQIYGHYPIINEQRIEYYCHRIHSFAFTNPENKWKAYCFTRNVYDKWMPAHFKRICSAVEQLPPKSDVSQSNAETGLPKA